MRGAACTFGVALLAAMVLVAVGDWAVAFTYFGVEGQPVVWPGAESTRYLSPTAFPAGSEPDELYLSAMGQWSSVPAADFQYYYVRLDEDYPIDHFDGYSDTMAVPPEQLDPGVLAVTYMVNDGADWYDMDMLLNSFPEGAGWNFEPNPDCDMIRFPAPDHGFSLLLVSLHELGHGIGLGEFPFGDEPPGTPFIVATMNPHYPMGGPIGQENIVELHTDDRNGARFLYPHSGPSDPPIRDLASAACAQGTIPGRAEPLFFDPPAANPGELFSARSVIENFGSTSEFSVHQGFYLSVDGVIEPSDLFIGEIVWDLAFEDAFEFDAIIALPGDLPSGAYFLGSFLDDVNEVDEVYEDNNAVVYCDPLTVNQLPPVVDPLPQETIVAGEPYTGPTPTVTHPLNMSPITWSLEDAPPGMAIAPATGVVTWPDPVPDPFLYTILIRATNGAGSSTQYLFLGVLQGPDACPADCGPGLGDGVVDVRDFLLVLAEWGSAGPFDCDMAPEGGDDRVGVLDLLEVLANWGACP
ncbi:MAG: putative Ig domain-containing protein [Planctomycetota bacterium]|jgi:hypothetical protein